MKTILTCLTVLFLSVSSLSSPSTQVAFHYYEIVQSADANGDGSIDYDDIDYVKGCIMQPQESCYGTLTTVPAPVGSVYYQRIGNADTTYYKESINLGDALYVQACIIVPSPSCFGHPVPYKGPVKH